MKAEEEDLRNLLSKIQYLIESSHENVPLNELKNIHTDLSIGITNVESQLAAERERFESRIDKLLQFMNTDQEIEHPHGNYYDRIIYCDGDFYWEADTEGNKPMNLNDVENLITSNPK
jgi:hypothetical protein